MNLLTHGFLAKKGFFLQALLLMATFVIGTNVLAQTEEKIYSPQPGAPLFEKIGDLHHPVSTDSPQAQKYFDQGLTLVYGFNHAEAVRSFKAVTRLDPDCAMGYWGVALALGPNINKPMDPKDVPEAVANAHKAYTLMSKTTAREKAYISAIVERYSLDPSARRTALDSAYAEAMDKARKNFPEDLDAATLYAESIMDLMPWNYYNDDLSPKPATIKVTEILESVLEKDPNHPGANHYYIHAVEPSETPGRAEGAADRLGGLVPDAGHLVHMPSHIYLRIGRYSDATKANEQAALSDESYISQCNAQGFYPALYYPHNVHFMWYTTSLEGRSRESIAAALKLHQKVSARLADGPRFLERFLPTPLFAYARFGKWQEILNYQQPRADFEYETAMWRFTRGLAFLNTGKIDEAQNELSALQSFEDSENMSSLNKTLVEIAVLVLAGEIAMKNGDADDGIAKLQTAVGKQDGLPYMEPPYWYFPVRHYLGAAFLESGKAEEAEKVYRKDLKKNPLNGWSLFGLGKTLTSLGKTDEAAKVQKQFKKSWPKADVKLTSSRF